MVRDILGALETGALAQIGLVAFVVAFAAILVYAFTMSRPAREQAKNLPLSDADELLPTSSPR